MPPMAAKEYRERAEECDRIAKSATSPSVRETLVYVASRWRALAEEEEAKDTRTKPPEGARPQRLSE